MPSPCRRVNLTIAPHDAARIAALAPNRPLSDFVYTAIQDRIYFLSERDKVITNITGIQAPKVAEVENAAPPYWGQMEALS